MCIIFTLLTDYDQQTRPSADHRSEVFILDMLFFSFNSFFFIRKCCETLKQFQKSYTPMHKSEARQQQKHLQIYRSVFFIFSPRSHIVCKGFTTFSFAILANSDILTAADSIKKLLSSGICDYELKEILLYLFVFYFIFFFF